MACSDVDMDIHGAGEGPQTPNREELPRIQYYAALEVIPDSKMPLHDLLQKQPAVLGVRHLTILSTSFYRIGNLIICDKAEFDIFISHIFCSDYPCKRSYQILFFK